MFYDLYWNKCTLYIRKSSGTLFRASASRLILVASSVISASFSLLGVLPLDTSRSATSEWRLEGEVNVLLGVQTDNEGRDVDNLKE